MNIIEKLGITKGPWEWHKDNCDYEICFRDEENKALPVLGYINGFEEARLITSSTEMLEALIDIHENINHPDMKRKIRIVIFKATGKTWEEIKALID